MTLFLFGIFVGSGLGFLAASLLSIGHDSDLIDRIQAQELHIRELARRLQDAQALANDCAAQVESAKERLEAFTGSEAALDLWLDSLHEDESF